MAILIVYSSQKQDDSIAAVEDHLKADGAPYLRLDSNRFPLAADLWCSEEVGEGLIRTEEGELRGSEVSSLWLRHTNVAADHRELVQEDYQTAVVTQSALVLAGWISSLPCFQLDPLTVLSSVPDSLGQLHLARAMGLQVPRTYVGNDVAQAGRFLESCREHVIIKFYASSAQKVPGPEGYRYLPTQRVTEEMRANLPRLALCPMILQEEVPKYRELRITVVGKRVFAAAVDPRGSALGEVDWRQDPDLVGSFVPWKLDEQVEARLLRILDRMRMNFATRDVIVTPTGEHVFLEINNVSYFDFIERCTEMPISRAVADLLTGKAAPRVAYP